MNVPWYSRMPANCSIVIFATAEPIASKAALLGAKTVRSLALSIVFTRLALVRAPATALRPAAIAVVEIF